MKGFLNIALSEVSLDLVAIVSILMALMIG